MVFASNANSLVPPPENDVHYSIQCTPWCSNTAMWTDTPRLHVMKAGVQTEVTEQLMKEAKIEALQEWQKYVAMIFDE